MRMRDLPDKFTRQIAIRREDVNEKARTVAVSFSSQTDKVSYYGAPQILLHERGAADFSALRDAGSVLFNHNPDVILGHPLDVVLDEKERKGRAVIMFDDDAEADKIFKKVVGGSVRGTSVGFRVDKWQVLDAKQTWTSPGGQEFRGPAYLGVKWRAFEFSITPTPADPSVGIGRTVGPEQPAGDTMDLKELREALAKRGLKAEATDEEVLAFAAKVLADDAKARLVKPDGEGDAKDGPGDGDGEGEDAKVPAAKRSEDPKTLTFEEGMRRERERTRAIHQMCSRFDATREIAQDLCSRGLTVEQAREEVLTKLSEAWPSHRADGRIHVGLEEHTKWARAAEDKLALRTPWGPSAIKDEKRVAAANEIEEMSLLDLARGALQRIGVRTKGMGKDALIERAISHGSSDFPNLLMNVANKALLAGYAETPATWRQFVRVVSRPDFKLGYMVRLSDAGDLIETGDMEPMPESSFDDRSDSFAIATYSRRFGLSRRAIINDDLSAFDEIPRAMGAAAKRVPGNLYYALLMSASGVGPTMAEDSKALFATDHPSGANYIATAGAIAIATLGAAKKLMRMQTGFIAGGETPPILNLTPKYLLVPAALEGVALQYTTQLIPNQSSNVVPQWQTALQVVVEPKLDGGTDGTVNWYLISDPALLACAQVAFLDGKEEPTMIRQEGTNILGVEWGVYFDCGVKFVDHRGMFRQKGS